MTSADQLASDEAFARQLQQEELSYVNPHDYNARPSQHGHDDDHPPPIPNEHSGARSPLLFNAGVHLNPHGLGRPANRAVHRNAFEEMRTSIIISPRVLTLYLVGASCELLASIIILSLQWNEVCNQPLRWWLLVFEWRYAFLIPLTVMQYLQRGQINQQQQKVQRWVDFLAFMWWICGQMWIYQSESCSSTAPLLYKFCIVLIAIMYLYLLLPIILLLLICFCLPFFLLILRALTPSRGASTDLLATLPTRIYRTGDNDNRRASSSNNSDHHILIDDGNNNNNNSNRVPSANENDDESPQCSICMDEYKDGDELRVLPCEHEFHKNCADRWLIINMTCPLCRTSIGNNGGNASANDARPENNAIEVV